MGPWITFIAVFAIILVVGLFTWLVPVIHWYIASSAGLRIGLGELVKWRFQRLSVDAIIEAMIRSKQHGLPIDKYRILHYAREGRDVLNVVTGLSAAKKYNIVLDLEKALEADRRGIPIEEGIRQLADRRSKKDQQDRT